MVLLDGCRGQGKLPKIAAILSCKCPSHDIRDQETTGSEMLTLPQGKGGLFIDHIDRIFRTKKHKMGYLLSQIEDMVPSNG